MAVENDRDYTFVAQTTEKTYVHTQSDREKDKRTTYRVCAVSESESQSDGILAYINPMKSEKQ